RRAFHFSEKVFLPLGTVAHQLPCRTQTRNHAWWQWLPHRYFSHQDEPSIAEERTPGRNPTDHGGQSDNATTVRLYGRLAPQASCQKDWFQADPHHNNRTSANQPADKLFHDPYPP